jgi:hypothetical protein
MKKLIGFMFLFSVATAHGDPKATHGMVLFGDKTTYMSHLPMFHAPHDYQLVAQISVGEITRGALFDYEQLKSAGHSLFTLVPKPMDLTQVISGQITQFQALLYDGHFEKEGTSLGTVQVTVQKILVSKKLEPASAEKGKFLVFGKADEYYAVHLIDGKPNYDGIFNVSIPYSLQVTHCRTRVCSDVTKIPVSEDQLPMVLGGMGLGSDGLKIPKVDETLGTLGDFMSDVKKVIYVEEGELSH